MKVQGKNLFCHKKPCFLKGKTAQLEKGRFLLIRNLLYLQSIGLYGILSAIKTVFENIFTHKESAL